MWVLATVAVVAGSMAFGAALSWAVMTGGARRAWLAVSLAFVVQMVAAAALDEVQRHCVCEGAPDAD